MTGGRDESTCPQHSLTRRATLQVAGLASLLAGLPGSVARAAGSSGPDATTGGRATDEGAVAGRRTRLDADGLRHAASVALSGDSALVGVPPAPVADGPDDGSVTVFEQRGGTWRRGRCLGPDGDAGQFGRAVALDGDVAVVGGELGGAPGGDHAGSATVFSREDGEWRRRTILHAPGSRGVDFFGTATAVAGDVVLVGAKTARVDDRRSGAVWAFERTREDWSRTGTLAPPSADVDRFGRVVAVDGDVAVVGARRPGDGASDGGVAIVYHRSGSAWRRRATLASSEDDVGDGFGTAVAVTGETILVGAPTATTAAGTNAGAVHVFVRSATGWDRSAVLQDPNGTAFGRFGTALALDGDRALVGAGSDRGPFAFVRTGEDWSPVIVRDDGDRERTESAVALDAGRAVVVARGDPGTDAPARATLEEYEP